MATGEGIAAIIKSVDDLSDGWFIVHKAKREAMADVAYSQLYIEQLREKGIELSESEAKAFAIMNARAIKSSENLSAILDEVHIPDDAEVERIDDEWYSAWIDGAKDAFSEWNRALYRRAMEMKAVDPLSFSRTSLGIIARLEEGDLLAIERVMGLVPLGDDHPAVPMIVVEDEDLLDLLRLSESQIGHLCDVGIIRQSQSRLRRGVVISSGYLDYPGNAGCAVATRQDGFDLMVGFEFAGDIKAEVPSERIPQGYFERNGHSCYVDYGNYVFTEAGKEICKLLEPEPPREISRYLTASYERVQKAERDAHRSTVMSEREFDRVIRASLDRIGRR